MGQRGPYRRILLPQGERRGEAAAALNSNCTVNLLELFELQALGLNHPKSMRNRAD